MLATLPGGAPPTGPLTMNLAPNPPLAMIAKLQNFNLKEVKHNIQQLHAKMNRLVSSISSVSAGNSVSGADQMMCLMQACKTNLNPVWLQHVT